MTDDQAGASLAARRWLRTLRIVRKRTQDSVPPPSRYLLVVTPEDPDAGSPLHVEAGSNPWALADRGGEVVRRRGVPCVMSVHDLEVAALDLGTVAWLHLDAEGDVATRPPDADGPEGRSDVSDAVDVDRIAEWAERLDLVSPDLQGPDEGVDDGEVLLVIHIAGGLLADVGSRAGDVPHLRVVVIDDDNYEGGDDAYTECVTAIEEWPTGPDDALACCRAELPDDLVEELGIPEPTPRPDQSD